jgi:hypothetical protein
MITKLITEPTGFEKLINSAYLDPFTPYYMTEISYIAPRDGERPNRIYTITGRGETEYQSHEAAINKIIDDIAGEVRDAESAYLASIGAGNLDIA